MEKSNGNGVSPSNGLKGRPPYSVETPYGFRLDLDFLKYVDDIEKGNTIKRVPIHRRSRAPRASTLPRHLNLSSWGGYRPGPWGSTGALSSTRPRPSDARQQGYGSWAFDGGSGGAGALASPAASRAEMEASIRAFDEQPLGEHIRPHLLRASSLPLTVLLRKGSESTDDAGSLRSSRDRLGGRDASCEDVFDSAGDSPSPAPSGAVVSRDFSGTLRRLGEALERVGELEAEVRVVPELRAQIRALREERERLRLGVAVAAPRPAANGAKEPSYATSDLKRPRQEGSDGHARNRGTAAAEEEEEDGEEHAGGRGWRTSTDLDELLTVTSLQAKVAALEQRLHESVQELQRARALLRDQLDEGRRKDERLAELSGNAGARARAERAAAAGGAGPDEGRPALGGSNLGGPASAGAPTAAVDGHRGQPNCSVDTDDKEPRIAGRSPQEEAPPGGLDPAHHVGRIRRLLEQQWVLLCAGREREGGGGGAPEHPDPKVTSLQQEMMGLVHTLSRFYSHDEAEGDGLHHGGPKSIMKRNGNVRTSKNLHFAGVNEGCETAWGGAPVREGGDKDSVRGHRGSEQARRATPGDAAAVAGRERGTPPPGGAPPSTDRTAGGAGQTERADMGATAAAAGGPPEEPGGPSVSDGNPGREPPGGRGSVSEEFMAACQFLKDHMDNMDNPNDEMRCALVVLFQNWFRVAAEEGSLAGGVSEHLGEVRTATPALLPFLVNLADDNGNTALHYSVSHSNYGIVGLLLQTGVCEVDLQNKAGYTAVMLASLTAPSGPGDTGVVHRLMELADVNARSSQAGQSALLLAVRHGRAPMVRTLLGRGADPNVRDRQGTTALMCASERGHAHIARLLLDTARCDVGLTDRAGRTALSIAVQGSHSDTAALLQAHVKARGL